MPDPADVPVTALSDVELAELRVEYERLERVTIGRLLARLEKAETARADAEHIEVRARGEMISDLTVNLRAAEARADRAEARVQQARDAVNEVRERLAHVERLQVVAEAARPYRDKLHRKDDPRWAVLSAALDALDADG